MPMNYQARKDSWYIFLSLTASASKRLLGRCEPDFPNLAEFHMLLGLPKIVLGLHGKPTFRRTSKSLGKT